MRKLVSLLAAVCITSAAIAQVRYVDALDAATMVGKALPTSHPYHRIDTAAYKGFVGFEPQQVRCSAGLALVFKTNSTRLDVWPRYNFEFHSDDTPDIASAGFDLYIRRDGEWVYAASHVSQDRSKPLTLIANMDDSEKECLLYLPIYSELGSLEIGVDAQAAIAPVANPFRHKIVIFGSSYTHGVCCSRPGMSYPMQIQRSTGLNICSVACSGNCKLQPYFADYLADVADADAFVFDAFSNPLDYMIEQSLIPFIERIRAKQPATPLIFVQTIYRESGNFDLAARAVEQAKRDAARRMMAEAMRRFDNVYFIDHPTLTGNDHATSVDGVHPSDLGYWRWAQNLEPELRKVLRKHGIR